jgi:hypothetical protein
MARVAAENQNMFTEVPLRDGNSRQGRRIVIEDGHAAREVTGTPAGIGATASAGPPMRAI